MNLVLIFSHFGLLRLNPVAWTQEINRPRFHVIIDEHSRFCLAIRVGRRCKAKDVLAVLKE
ncbi:MAG: hypothetical protein EB101_11320, partial [Chitinophagia bacterium]|nr:hypothetical protein [Chitinophagia bacterium]